MGILSKASDLKDKAKGAASRLNEANRKRIDAKQQKTKDKYERQMRREAEKLKKVQQEQRVVQARLRTANVKRQLSREKEARIVGKIEDVKDIGRSAQRILGHITGKRKPVKPKRKKRRG